MASVLQNKHLKLKISKKAWLSSCAFFVCAFLFFPSAYADCSLPVDALEKLERVHVERVVDGDTLILSDERKVRLIGVNTPELKGKAPFSLAAKNYLVSLLSDSQALYLDAGLQAEDRYGRLLAHAYLPDGSNIESLILQQGLGYLVAIPPNIDRVVCLEQARNLARANQLGVWQGFQAVDAKRFTAGDAGFQFVEGILTKVDKAGRYWWLQLDGLVVLRIDASSQKYFDYSNLNSLIGKRVRASGWVVDRSHTVDEKYSPFMLLLKHPVHLQAL